MRKTKVFYLQFLIFIFISLLSVSSFIFYNKSLPKNIDKIRFNEYLSIDSIKTISVQDTVSYFKSLMLKSKNSIDSKDSMLSEIKSEYSNIKKERDSLYTKVEYYRYKYIHCKDSIN